MCKYSKGPLTTLQQTEGSQDSQYGAAGMHMRMPCVGGIASWYMWMGQQIMHVCQRVHCKHPHPMQPIFPVLVHGSPLLVSSRTCKDRSAHCDTKPQAQGWHQTCHERAKQKPHVSRISEYVYWCKAQGPTTVNTFWRGCARSQARMRKTNLTPESGHHASSDPSYCWDNCQCKVHLLFMLSVTRAATHGSKCRNATASTLPPSQTRFNR